MYGVLGEQNTRNGLLVGFLSQKLHFGSVETWIGGPPSALRLWANGDHARLDPGKRMETDWACLHFLHLDAPDPLAPYLEAVAREHYLGEFIHHNSGSPTGWCSWYQFSSEDFTGMLTAEDINHNLRASDDLRSELPLDIIQIDDGFETQVGDWFTFQDGFPEGLAPLAAEISHRGFTPGIWLAPFILHPKAKLANRHPDWLLRNRLGLPVNAGFLWNTFPRVLDLTQPDALGYVHDVVESAVNEWGFPYLKLDFLYAAALPGHHRDQTQTRAQILRTSLEAIREAAGGETFLLGCGCPLGPAIGLVDGMRIGADTATRWRPSFRGVEYFIKDEHSLPAAFNALHNALTRSDLHQRWWINDPDCLLLRPETHLTRPEVQTIASVIGLSGGSMLLSDHLPDLPQDRLRIAEALLPLIEKRPFILDWFDSQTPERLQLNLDGALGTWHLLAQINWQDEARDLSLNLVDYYLEPLGEMYAREFWSGNTYVIPKDDIHAASLIVEQVAPHGVIIFALRSRHPHVPQYLGSDLHISQGLEVIEWSPLPGGLSFRLQRPGFAQGRIEIATPRPVEAVSLAGDLIPWRSKSLGTCVIDLEFHEEAKIEIDYQ
jgi:alpha-galactosidase